MKKTLVVIALALVLALSFATIATAKYAGYAYNNPVLNADSSTSANEFPGYLSWTGAKAIYDRNNPGGTDMTSAHGGYVSTTTKCAVCHSAHRAYSASASVAGTAPANNSLTSGAACVNCHTVWGGGSSSKKIEWENLLTTTSSDPGGPHHHADPTCTGKCHTGGVHGGGTSTYNGMNAFMLGSDKDAAITAAFTAGNVGPTINNDPAGNGTAANWFRNGKADAPSDGGYPASMGTSGYSYPAAKSMATGYTCAQAGCHTSSQFAVNKWGFAENHASDPRASGTLDQPFTGHLSGFERSNYSVPNCGPCHGGAPAGGYRMDTAFSGDNQLARQYGCDQCHDMVGKLTNTTAWPHGNRAIDVWEWDDTGAKVTLAGEDLPDGNLWMYSADISKNISIPVAGNTNDKANITPDRPSFRVIQGTIFHDGKVGTINDSVCLKCHVPIDAKSLAARGLTTSDSLNPATTRGALNLAGNSHSAAFNDGVFYDYGYGGGTPALSGGSNRIYLWK